MARYRGPKTKIARRMGEPIFGPDSSFEKRKYPPGQHGNTRRRGKKSEYSVQLQEKQKAKYTYGILERQFARMFDKASRSKGKTGDVLLQLCESRLDNGLAQFIEKMTHTETQPNLLALLCEYNHVMRVLEVIGVRLINLFGLGRKPLALQPIQRRWRAPSPHPIKSSNQTSNI